MENNIRTTDAGGSIALTTVKRHKVVCANGHAKVAKILQQTSVKCESLSRNINDIIAFYSSFM
jgi:hypothetical protein